MNLPNNYKNDLLLETVSSIASEFEKHNIPTIVGGGMGLLFPTRTNVLI
jgi:hypothetical protein